MTSQEVKEVFLEFKQLKLDIMRLKESVRDIRESIGDIQLCASNGMPRSSQVEHESDAHKKLVKMETILNGQYKQKVKRSQELMLMISSWLSDESIPVEISQTLRMYHIRTFYCNDKKCYRNHSEVTVAKKLNITSVAARKRLEKGYEHIAKF
ncbi:MAG: hypothetical protein ACRCWQ_01705 [Bacilli bacterium]